MKKNRPKKNPRDLRVTTEQDLRLSQYLSSGSEIIKPPTKVEPSKPVKSCLRKPL